MRFFFNLHNDVDTIDEDGRELPNVAAARAAAEDEVRVMAAESVRMGHLNMSHHVEVTDDTGACLFKVTFGEVIRVCGQSAASKE